MWDLEIVIAGGVLLLISAVIGSRHVETMPWYVVGLMTGTAMMVIGIMSWSQEPKLGDFRHQCGYEKIPVATYEEGQLQKEIGDLQSRLNEANCDVKVVPVPQSPPNYGPYPTAPSDRDLPGN